jgi:hypothetical protein
MFHSTHIGNKNENFFYCHELFVLPGIEKTTALSSSKTQNNCSKISGLIGNSVTHSAVRLGSLV